MYVTYLASVGPCKSIGQARRQGGFEGVRANLPFDLQKIYTSKLHILSILLFESGPLVLLLVRITTVQTSLVAATVPGYAISFMGDQCGTRV